VLNRRGFEERMQVELDRARRDATPLGVASFDIDHFKTVNDDFGHEIGDRVLARLGRLLREETRATDVVARMGGEEFLVLLPGCGADETSAFAERIRARFAEPGGLPAVTLSAGVSAAVAPPDGALLIAESDTALYTAKRSGRDRTVVSERPGCATAV
jgi:diguanylate cyclase (GGDEF)-like protein